MGKCYTKREKQIIKINTLKYDQGKKAKICFSGQLNKTWHSRGWDKVSHEILLCFDFKYFWSKNSVWESMIRLQRQYIKNVIHWTATIHKNLKNNYFWT